MNVKQFVAGAVVGAIVLLIAGYVIWDMLFASFFAMNTGGATGVDRQEWILWPMVLGSLSHAALITLGVGTRKQPGSLVEGIKVGAVVGFLIWFTADFTLYAIQDVNNLTGTIADSLLEAVRGAITGAAIAVVVGMLGGARNRATPSPA